VYKCLHGNAPAYLTDELCQVADVEARQRLRSSASSSLIVSRTRLLTVGDRAFPVAVARVWNSLPDLVTSAPSVAVFRSRFKTHLPPVIVQCLCSDFSCYGHYNRSCLFAVLLYLGKHHRSRTDENNAVDDVNFDELKTAKHSAVVNNYCWHCKPLIYADVIVAMATIALSRLRHCDR